MQKVVVISKPQHPSLKRFKTPEQIESEYVKDLKEQIEFHKNQYELSERISRHQFDEMIAVYRRERLYIDLLVEGKNILEGLPQPTTVAFMNMRNRILNFLTKCKEFVK